MTDLSEFGLKVPEILLPKEKNLETWCVVACDQFTQNPEYWENVKNATQGKPSTLNIILPEVFLSADDRAERISKIKNTMNDYLSGGVFDSPKEQIIYLERTTPFGRKRCGLICALDLDSYEWKPFAKSLVRATEATIVERIPPRKEIRNGASLESPHIMLLVNDREHKLVEGCGNFAKKNPPCYDSDLMLSSGHVTGWALDDEEMLLKVKGALGEIKAKNTSSCGDCFLFAVGDGNHSLATAKAVWEEYKARLLSEGKSEAEVMQSRVRYALVEIVNIYDEGLTFEPIHRVLLNVNADELIKKLADSLGGKIEEAADASTLEKSVHGSNADFGFIFMKDGKCRYVLLKTSIKELAVSRLQPVLDEYIAENKKTNPELEIDYIHGSDELFRLGTKEGNVSLMLPPVAKDSFFNTINQTGPLPRKSFSMGEASEKRFYLECRKLF